MRWTHLWTTARPVSPRARIPRSRRSRCSSRSRTRPRRRPRPRRRRRATATIAWAPSRRRRRRRRRRLRHRRDRRFSDRLHDAAFRYVCVACRMEIALEDDDVAEETRAAFESVFPRHDLRRSFTLPPDERSLRLREACLRRARRPPTTAPSAMVDSASTTPPRAILPSPTPPRRTSTRSSRAPSDCVGQGRSRHRASRAENHPCSSDVLRRLTDEHNNRRCYGDALRRCAEGPCAGRAVRALSESLDGALAAVRRCATEGGGDEGPLQVAWATPSSRRRRRRRRTTVKALAFARPFATTLTNRMCRTRRLRARGGGARVGENLPRAPVRGPTGVRGESSSSGTHRRRGAGVGDGVQSWRGGVRRGGHRARVRRIRRARHRQARRAASSRRKARNAQRGGVTFEGKRTASPTATGRCSSRRSRNASTARNARWRRVPELIRVRHDRGATRWFGWIPFWTRRRRPTGRAISARKPRRTSWSGAGTRVTSGTSGRCVAARCERRTFAGNSPAARRPTRVTSGETASRRCGRRSTASAQTAAAKATTMPKKVRYVGGLRGGPEVKMNVVSLELDLGQPHEFDERVLKRRSRKLGASRPSTPPRRRWTIHTRPQPVPARPARAASGVSRAVSSIDVRGGASAMAPSLNPPLPARCSA